MQKQDAGLHNRTQSNSGSDSISGLVTFRVRALLQCEEMQPDPQSYSSILCLSKELYKRLQTMTHNVGVTQCNC